MTAVKYVSLDDPPGSHHHGTFSKSYRVDVKGFLISFDKNFIFLLRVCSCVLHACEYISHNKHDTKLNIMGCFPMSLSTSLP